MYVGVVELNNNNKLYTKMYKDMEEAEIELHKLMDNIDDDLIRDAYIEYHDMDEMEEDS